MFSLKRYVLSGTPLRKIPAYRLPLGGSGRSTLFSVYRMKIKRTAVPHENNLGAKC
jgi:hypothetical protein